MTIDVQQWLILTFRIIFSLADKTVPIILKEKT